MIRLNDRGGPVKRFAESRNRLGCASGPTLIGWGKPTSGRAGTSAKLDNARSYKNLNTTKALVDSCSSAPIHCPFWLQETPSVIRSGVRPSDRHAPPFALESSTRLSVAVSINVVAANVGGSYTDTPTSLLRLPG